MIVEGFIDEYERDLAAALWTTPAGDRVLVACGHGSGYVLYGRGEWNLANPSDLEADADGWVTAQGEYVDCSSGSPWRVPERVRAAAIR